MIDFDTSLPEIAEGLETLPHRLDSLTHLDPREN